MGDIRKEKLAAWLCFKFEETSHTINLQPLSGDAGFRRYFRVNINENSYIAVDSPSDLCNNQAFINVQNLLVKQGVHAPDIIFHDLSLGFLCLSDLGECLLSDILARSNNPIFTYEKAINSLVNITTSPVELCITLPKYDHELLSKELNIFTDWLLDKYLQLELNTEQKLALTRCFSLLKDNALEQPQVMVHRDFHSRNIMVEDDGKLAIIDFQDAVVGPITYDIVSLLRDCYVRWPEKDIQTLFSYFRHILSESTDVFGTDIKKYSDAQWQKWFDLMGLQRHFKACGIFARLHLRDNKHHYLKDIPLTLSYLIDITAKYSQFSSVNQLLQSSVLPALTTRMEHK